MLGSRGGRRQRFGRERHASSRAWLLPALLVASLVLFVVLRRRDVLARSGAAVADRLDRRGALEPSPTSAPEEPAGGIATAEPGAHPDDVVSDIRETAAPVAEEQDDTERDQIPGDGSLDCPGDFPVKGNATSKIYHLPGGSYYDRTRPNVCFRTPEAAERAGYRASKASPIRSAASQAGQGPP